MTRPKAGDGSGARPGVGVAGSAGPGVGVAASTRATLSRSAATTAGTVADRTCRSGTRVDGNDGTARRGSGVAREEDERRGDLLRLRPARWVDLRHRGAVRRGVDRARRDRVHGDAVLAYLVRDGARER